MLVGILLKDVQRNPDSELVRFFGGVAKCGGAKIRVKKG